MNGILEAIQNTIGSIPMPLLQVWGLLAYITGFPLAIAAFGGFTFRPGGHWGLGRERQAWDTTAIMSIPLTFVLVVAAGYLGSFVVLVPGAQTLESLKDLMVFLTIILFGYPALLIIPFAYGLSDLIEGVPPQFVLEWLPGYFINPACFWIAYQLIGRDPDFKKAKTWGGYLLFILLFVLIEPVLWGYICADRFTAAISYRAITSALIFTTGLTWLVAPLAMLGALPIARRLRLFWAEIPGHTNERLLRERSVVRKGAWPLQLAMVAPFVAIILISVGATAFVSLLSAQNDAKKLASHLLGQTADGLSLRLSRYLSQPTHAAEPRVEIGTLLSATPVSEAGLVAVTDSRGEIIAVSPANSADVLRKAIAYSPEKALNSTRSSFEFNVISEKPLAHDTWLALAASYVGQDTRYRGWRIFVAIPESYYLAGIKTGHSRSALMFALALLIAIVAAALLAGIVTRRLRRMSVVTYAMAQGNLGQQVEDSKIEELHVLAQAFNDMAGRLNQSFENLNCEIEQRKEAEAALNNLNTSLERHVTERTAELKTALVRAEAADRTKSAFLAIMSHELRTPLNSIIGFTGLVLQGMAGPLTTEQSKQLGMVRESANHLLSLINDILDISKIEANQFQFHRESVEIRPLLDRTLSSVGPLVMKKGLGLEAHFDSSLDILFTDSRRLGQVLLNLLQNAVKFTNAGQVIVTARMESSVNTGARQLRISVSDTGIGIKADDLPALFQPFHQVNNTLSRQHEGPGLGLAISHRLISQLGGELTVQSEWGKGSTFTFTLPAGAEKH